MEKISKRKMDEKDPEKIHILHIEDNPDDQMILRRSLEKNLEIDFVLKTAKNGTEGLRKIEEETFDLILLDYKLSGMTGIEFLEELKKMNPGMDVIFVTGKGSEKIAVQAMKFGARDYVVKEELTNGSTHLVNTIKNLLVESAIPKEVNIEVTKRILSLFSESPTIQFELLTSLKSKLDDSQPMQELLPILTKLVEMEILEAKPLRSVISCPSCNSLNCTLYLRCPECNSAQMKKGDALEHFGCGEVNFKTMYEREDGKLVCPKCEKELKVLGADYGKNVAWHRCSNGHLFNSPNLIHKCLECNKEFSSESAILETLYEYRLSEKGLRKLRISLLMDDSKNAEGSLNRNPENG